jgi:hypothetical protein
LALNVPATAQAKVAAGRSIVRSLYALSRSVRLFGLSHSRTREQLDAIFAKIRQLNLPSGLVFSVQDDRLTIDSVLLENGAAEQSFARFLRQINQTAFRIDEHFSMEALEDVVSAMAFDRTTLRRTSFEATSGSSAESTREWLTAAMLMQFVTAAGKAQGLATDRRIATVEHSPEDLSSVFRLVRQLARSHDEAGGRIALENSPLPSSMLAMVRDTLKELTEQLPPLTGRNLLLRVADRVTIREIQDKVERSSVATADVPALVEQAAQQLGELRTEILAQAEAKTSSHPRPESLANAIESELWSTASDAAMRNALLFDTPYYVPAISIASYLERLIAQGEELVAATILKNYAMAVDGREAEGRRRSVIGIPELAELYILVAPDYAPKLMAAISRQLMREADVHMQSLLSTALIRLNYAAQQQRDFVATAAASDALEEIGHRRPVLGMELRPRISVENRLPEYIDEALTSKRVSSDLLNLLQRHSLAVTQQLCDRFRNTNLREESERLTNLARELGDETRDELLQRLRTGNSDETLGAVGLLCSLAPEELAVILPRRASSWTRAQQDFLVRQLSIVPDSSRGRILLGLLPQLDILIVPGAIDEVGMSGETNAASSLVQMAMEERSRVSAYSKVKAIEALGRLRAATAVGALNEILHARRLFQWVQPHELRTAALQALHMIDPERAARVAPQTGITDRELSVGPLAVSRSNPWARQRRYSRILPVKPVAATASLGGGKTCMEIVEISLGGGKARIGGMQSTADMTLQLHMAMRRVNSHVLIRDVRPNEITFEIADIALPDRSRFRQLLLAQTPEPPPRAAA